MVQAYKMIQKTKNLMDFRKKLIQLKIKAFEPKILIEKEIGDFVVKTAQTKEELEAILRLRYDVFIEEGLKKKKFIKIDFDKYDIMADHIIVQVKETRKVIGTYRLLCSHFTDLFYSENEFSLDNFLKSPGTKLELGRACIHKDHRNGVTINLVWKGLGAYAQAVNADYMFGCASVKTIDPVLSCSLQEYMKPHHAQENFGIEPIGEFRFDPKELKIGEYSAEFLDSQIPSLLKSYIKAGAKIYGPPAVDYDFDCIDFLTIIDLHKLDARYRARYMEK